MAAHNTIIMIEVRGFNQHGVAVMSFERKVLI
jgi:hypothetical protein